MSSINGSAESLVPVDALLEAILKRQHHNEQLRARIRQLEGSLAQLEGVVRKVEGEGRVDAAAVQALVQQSDTLHAHMSETEAELAKQGVAIACASCTNIISILSKSVPAKADLKKDEERQSVAQGTHEGVDELMEIVHSGHQ